MATLNEVFTNIANAIRSKKGTTDKMTPTNMPSEIESIESGSSLVGYSGGTFKKIDSYFDYVYAVCLMEDGTLEKYDLSKTQDVSVAGKVVRFQIISSYLTVVDNTVNCERNWSANSGMEYNVLGDNWSYQIIPD